MEDLFEEVDLGIIKGKVHRYEYSVDGILMNRLTCKSIEELKEGIDKIKFIQNQK